MTFTSWQFGAFVAIVFGVYYLPLLKSLQVQLLVVSSLFFYGYGQPELLPLLDVAVLGTYLFLILALRNRALWLPIGISFNLVLLAFFKYKFLFIGPASPGAAGLSPIDFLLQLPLPIGISFFVFHNISLLVDLTGKRKEPPDIQSVFLYIIFFPQLVSGPFHAADPAEIFPGCSVRRGREMDTDGVLFQTLRREQPQRDDILYGFSSLR